VQTLDGNFSGRASLVEAAFEARDSWIAGLSK
jgi:hypothetical protein